MNQRTAKLLRLHGFARSQTVNHGRYRDAKKKWLATPRDKRFALRLLIEKDLRRTR